MLACIVRCYAWFAGAGEAVVLARFTAFRGGLYARMEEISFRASMAVLAGVAALAAIIAGVTLAVSQGSPAARPAAFSPAPARHSPAPTSAPPTPAASPSRAAPTASARTRTRAPAVADPLRPATYPATDEYSAPSRSFPDETSGRAASRPRINSAVTAWAAWWRSHLRGGHVGGLPAGGGHGFGGFGGHGFGHR